MISSENILEVDKYIREHPNSKAVIVSRGGKEYREIFALLPEGNKEDLIRFYYGERIEGTIPRQEIKQIKILSPNNQHIKTFQDCPSSASKCP